MSGDSYSSGKVAQKLNLSRRTVTYRAARGRIPGMMPWDKGAHRRFRRQVIDQLAQDLWPPVRASVDGGTLKVQLCGLAKEPLMVSPCPGELPAISIPDLYLPGDVRLPAVCLPRIPSPFEVIQGLERHLWG